MQADDQGRLKGDASYIKAHCVRLVQEISEEDVPRLLNELKAQRMIQLYRHSGDQLVQITRWFEGHWQAPRRAFPSRWAPPPGWNDLVFGIAGHPETLEAAREAQKQPAAARGGARRRAAESNEARPTRADASRRRLTQAPHAGAEPEPIPEPEPSHSARAREGPPKSSPLSGEEQAKVDLLVDFAERHDQVLLVPSSRECLIRLAQLHIAADALMDFVNRRWAESGGFRSFRYLWAAAQELEGEALKQRPAVEARGGLGGWEAAF